VPDTLEEETVLITQAELERSPPLDSQSTKEKASRPIAGVNRSKVAVLDLYREEVARANQISSR
jgi:hypothetical protein